MDSNLQNTQTSLHISEEVVLTVANEAIKELDGAAVLASLPAKRSFFAPAASAKPVRINLSADVAEIDIGIAVNMNHRLKDVCEQVQTKVKDAVQNMTGIAVAKVNVYVAGVMGKNNAEK